MSDSISEPRTPTSPRSATLLLLLAAVLFQAQAALPDQAKPAAYIDGAPVHALTLRALRHAASEQPDRPSAEAVLATIVADRLQAPWSRKRFSAAQLYPASTVGFAPQATVEQRLAGLVRSLYARELDAAVRALPGASLDSLVEATYPLDPPTLERLFGAPGALRLGYDFTPEQAALAARTPLLRYRLGAGPALTLSVLDVYRRQNVQGRMAFFQREHDVMLAQARQQLASLFVLDWAGRHCGAAALADLRQALDEQETVRGAMRLYGLADGAEAHSPLQAALARQVSPAEIGAYYTAHIDQFRRIDKVRARHIRVGSEALAQRIRAELAAGKDFGTLARRHSLAPSAARGGDLGWIRRSAAPDWLSALALQQPAGTVSSPFRAAVGPQAPATWELLLVARRVEGVYPPDSETVRYMARRAIAHERARAEFAGVRTALVRAARVELMPTPPDATGAP
jgi:hypothetical protein